MIIENHTDFKIIKAEKPGRFITCQTFADIICTDTHNNISAKFGLYNEQGECELVIIKDLDKFSYIFQMWIMDGMSADYTYKQS